LDSLDDATRNDWDSLKRAFLARYTIPEFLSYKNARELFNLKQENDQSVGDFCAKMQHIARQVGDDDKMLRFAVLNGLRPDIANHVTQRQPNTWPELLAAARVGEMCTPVQSYATVCSQLNLMQDQLRQLYPKLTTSTVAQVTDGASNRLSRSVSPRRVRFEDTSGTMAVAHETMNVPAMTIGRDHHLGEPITSIVQANIEIKTVPQLDHSGVPLPQPLFLKVITGEEVVFAVVDQNVFLAGICHKPDLLSHKCAINVAIADTNILMTVRR